MVGEGAGILVLEELEMARARGASILAEVVGYGMSADAFHVTAPPDDGDGAFRVMRNAMRDAGIEPHQVDYINAHGTSTDVGDRAETMAIKRAFGDHAYKVAVSSTKSMTGHLLGGAGGMEAGITAQRTAPGDLRRRRADRGVAARRGRRVAAPARVELSLSEGMKKVMRRRRRCAAAARSSPPGRPRPPGPPPGGRAAPCPSAWPPPAPRRTRVGNGRTI